MNLRSKIPFFLASIKRDEAQPIWLEYLQSDSSAFIDTGVSGNNDNLSLNMTFYIENFVGYGSIFGNYVDEASNVFRVICAENESRIYFNANTRSTNATMRNVASFYGSKHTLRLGKTNLTIDGVSSPVTNISGTVNDTNIALFNRAVGNPIAGRDIGLKIYSCQMYDGNVMIRDFRPCLHPKTLEPCMYDMVTKQYFFNAGTGQFKYERTFDTLEYVGSTGTQYIDTGVYAPDITRFIIKGTCDTNNASNSQLLGTNINSAITFFGARYMSATGVKSWYCINAEGVSIGNPTDLSIIDCTIESRTSQYGTLIDLVNNTTSEFIRFASGEWGFANGNLILFGGEPTRRSPNATCYSLQLYTANGLVRDLRPCLRGNTPCMYDMVEGKYYMNAGTGELNGGVKQW